MNNKLIEIKNLKKTYNHLNGKITLFKDLNIIIQKGDLVALVGPSGSGKSSLIHLMALLDEPSKGNIKINSISTNNLRKKKKIKLEEKKFPLYFKIIIYYMILQQ